MRRISIFGLCALLVANCLMFPSYGHPDILIGGKSARTYDSQPYEEPTPKSIMDTLKDRGVYSTFLSDIADTELRDLLSGEGPLTVFAPRDDAFDALENSSIDLLSKDRQKLENLLKYHILLGNFTVDDLVSNGSLETVQGENLTIGDNSNGTLTLSGRTLLSKNRWILCTNGIIYPIDSLLAPEELRNQIRENVITGNLRPVSLFTPAFSAGNNPPGMNAAENLNVQQRVY
jgi:uncharacterized surface protein with fasciclin (FAS1) repeats